MSCKLSEGSNLEEQITVLLEENEKLRNEIRNITIITEDELSSNTTGVIKSNHDSIEKLLQSDSSSSFESEKSTVICQQEHPLRLNLKKDNPRSLVSRQSIDSTSSFISEKSTVTHMQEHPLLPNLKKDDLISTDTSDSELDISDDDLRTIGEIALQLDRRMLQYVFTPRQRLYGFTVRNIRAKIEESSTDLVEGKTDEEVKRKLTENFDFLLAYLSSYCGYQELYHAIFSEILVNSFGVLRSKSRKLMKYKDLKPLIERCLKKPYAREALILHESLVAIAKIDGKPLFI